MQFYLCSVTGVTNPGGLTASTEHPMLFKMLSAVLPMIKPVPVWILIFQLFSYAELDILMMHESLRFDWIFFGRIFQPL